MSPERLVWKARRRQRRSTAWRGPSARWEKPLLGTRFVDSSHVSTRHDIIVALDSWRIHVCSQLDLFLWIVGVDRIYTCTVYM
jgi:hypothetical protein